MRVQKGFFISNTEVEKSSLPGRWLNAEH